MATRTGSPSGRPGNPPRELSAGRVERYLTIQVSVQLSVFPVLSVTVSVDL